MPIHRDVGDNRPSATIARLGADRYPERFMSCFTASMAFLAALDRPAAYHRALWFALSRLDAQEYRRLSARQVAEGTGMSRSNAERALSMLQADRVIHVRGVSSDLERRLSRRLGWYQGATLFNEAELAAADPQLVDGRGRECRRSRVDMGEAPQRSAGAGHVG
mgnify:CR=1 FL=1